MQKPNNGIVLKNRVMLIQTYLIGKTLIIADAAA
jgi:hypothetical protein